MNYLIKYEFKVFLNLENLEIKWLNLSRNIIHFFSSLKIIEICVFIMLDVDVLIHLHLFWMFLYFPIKNHHY